MGRGGDASHPAACPWQMLEPGDVQGNRVRTNQHLAGDLSAAASVFSLARRGCSPAPVGSVKPTGWPEKTKVKAGSQTLPGIEILLNKKYSHKGINATSNKALAASVLRKKHPGIEVFTEIFLCWAAHIHHLIHTSH